MDETKYCPRCKRDRPFSDFQKNKNRKNGHQSYCRECYNKYSKEYYHNNETRQQQVKARNKDARMQLRKFVADYKANKACPICGENASCCLDFHHRHGKEMSIGEMVLTRCSISKLQEEISKCVLVCANCHRKIHAKLLDATDIPCCKF